jgi:hypothetical protein
MRRNRVNKKSRKQNRQGGRARESAIVRCPFKFGTTFTYAAATTQNAIDLSINNAVFDSTTRIYHLALNYAEFRFSKLHVTTYPFIDTSTADNAFIVAYLPAADSAVAAAQTFPLLMNINSSCLVPASKTMPTTLSLGKAFMLSTPQKWYATDATSPTINAAIQGSIIIKPRATSTCTLLMCLTGVLELRIPTLEGYDGLIKRMKSIKKDEEKKEDEGSCSSSQCEESKSARKERLLKELQTLV